VLMQKIRKSTMKHRKLLIAVVVILAVGLIGSFAVWNSDGIGSGGEVTTAEYIEYYETNIAELTPAEGVELDYDTAQTLGNLYYDLRSLYYNHYSETYPQDSAAEDYDAKVSEAIGYYQKSIESAVKAAEYYEKQLALAPETLNAYATADIMAKRASSLAFAQANDTARALFTEALELSPENINAAVGYVEFLYANDGMEAARTYADSYKELVGEENANYATMEQYIEYYEQLEQFYNELEKVQEENSENAEGTEEGTEEDNEEAAE